MPLNGKDIEQEVMKEESKKQREKIIHTEPIDTVAKCPNCRSNRVNWVFTKRGVAIKCLNCGMDTHFLQDVLSHRKRELEVLPILKRMFSNLTFVENTPIDTNFVTGETGSGKTRYDFKVFWLGRKLARCKVSVVQGTGRDHYIEAEEQYVQGRREVVDYLRKIDAVFIWYFPDEKDESKRIAMASCKDIVKFSVEKEDRFKNIQYHLPKEIRKIIIKTTFQDFKNLIFRNFYDLITEGVYIV